MTDEHSLDPDGESITSCSFPPSDSEPILTGQPERV